MEDVGAQGDFVAEEAEVIPLGQRVLHRVPLHQNSPQDEVQEQQTLTVILPETIKRKSKSSVVYRHGNAAGSSHD